MAKRWTIREDLMLVSFFEAVGDFIGTHDLGRPAGAATNRVKHLKATGAWQHLKALQRCEFECLRGYADALGVGSEARFQMLAAHAGERYDDEWSEPQNSVVIDLPAFVGSTSEAA